MNRWGRFADNTVLMIAGVLVGAFIMWLVLLESSVWSTFVGMVAGILIASLIHLWWQNHWREG